MTASFRSAFDPYLTAIIANRVDGIVREMTNTLLRAARSAVINSARDFSCAICTSDNYLLAAAEGLPIHVFGSHLLTDAMAELHGGNILEGDCFLHNDPYLGNTHAADHAFLVPVFFEGEHLFTTVAKAHQADIGNGMPTTYMASARDQYEEGALIFPAVRIQRDYVTNYDIVRMCQARIRAPEQWHGDFLAGIGAARIAERRLKELCEKYGKSAIKAFVAGWLDYSEQRMASAIRQLPKVKLSGSSAHDPLAGILPDGIPINLTIAIDPEAEVIELDLRDNIDNVPCGLNESEACVTAAAFSGVFNSLDPSLPRNSGAFRRLRILLKDGSVCGRPKFPHSCSVATTNVADRIVNLTQSTLARMGDGFGLAEGGVGMGAGCAVVSGTDYRAQDARYVNQLVLAAAGGPGSASADGWPTYGIPVNAGLMYRDSVEIDELKHPLRVDYIKILPGTAGAGKFRGCPAMEIRYGPRDKALTAMWPCDGTHFAPKGVRGGRDGCLAQHWRIAADGTEQELNNVVSLTLGEGESVRGHSTSGAGYGDPFTRDSSRVLKDVLEGYETVARAQDVYGVVLRVGLASTKLEVDDAATYRLRSARLTMAVTLAQAT